MLSFDVQVSDSLEPYADEALMASLSLVVQCWTGGAMTGPQGQGLSKAVAAGVGLAGWHGGIIDSFRQDTNYQFMTGGQWVAHPGGCIPEYRVRVTDRDHVITRGLADFTLRETEQYYIHVDPGVHQLCSTVFEGQHGETWAYPAGTVMPYAYTRQWGQGRVFVACWGHTFKDFDVPEAAEMVRRGIVWAAK